MDATIFNILLALPISSLALQKFHVSSASPSCTGAPFNDASALMHGKFTITVVFIFASKGEEMLLSFLG